MGQFNDLFMVNVNDHIEKKKTGGVELSYLSWAWAWAEVKTRYPEATYSIVKAENGLPYVYDPLTGYMVYTTVTIDGITHEMWLPVMDGANRAMKSEAYTITNKFGKTSTVEAATMFDINKTIMRCLVKNLAMFGLGLYIYAGEDLPDGDTEQPKKEKAEVDEIDLAKLKARVIGYINRHNYTPEQIEKICKSYGVEKLTQLDAAACQQYIGFVTKKGGNIDE